MTMEMALFIVISFTLVLIFALVCSAVPPLKKLRVRCPEFATMRRVAFAFNPFRSPREKGEGIDVVFCSRFGNKPVICKKTCISYCESKTGIRSEEESLFSLKLWGTILIVFLEIGTGIAHAEHKKITLVSETTDIFAFVDEKGAKNPTLEINEGDTVELVLHNGDGIPHILTIPDLDKKSGRVDAMGETTIIRFVAKKGEFAYFCPLPGHRRMGMEGKIVCRKRK